MSEAIIDILYVTYNRPEYVQLTLPRLLETCDERMRVWLWHNGDDAATLAAVRAIAEHPRVKTFHHSPENLRLRVPTNWLWTHADGDLFCKIDDDNLMPDGWGDMMRRHHAADAKVGVLGCWPFLESDVVDELARPKLRDLGGGLRVLRNCWVAGTGCVIKREVVMAMGTVPEGMSFPRWCIHAAARGWINGFPWPLIVMPNLDDPRSPLCRFKTEDEFRADPGLSAVQFGIRSLEELKARQAHNAYMLLRSPLDPGYYLGWRGRLNRAAKKIRNHLLNVSTTPAV